MKNPTTHMSSLSKLSVNAKHPNENQGHEVWPQPARYHPVKPLPAVFAIAVPEEDMLHECKKTLQLCRHICAIVEWAEECCAAETKRPPNSIVVVSLVTPPGEPPQPGSRGRDASWGHGVVYVQNHIIGVMTPDMC